MSFKIRGLEELINIEKRNIENKIRNSVIGLEYYIKIIEKAIKKGRKNIKGLQYVCELNNYQCSYIFSKHFDRKIIVNFYSETNAEYDNSISKLYHITIGENN